MPSSAKVKKVKTKKPSPLPARRGPPSPAPTPTPDNTEECSIICSDDGSADERTHTSFIAPALSQVEGSSDLARQQLAGSDDALSQGSSEKGVEDDDSMSCSDDSTDNDEAEKKDDALETQASAASLLGNGPIQQQMGSTRFIVGEIEPHSGSHTVCVGCPVGPIEAFLSKHATSS